MKSNIICTTLLAAAAALVMTAPHAQAAISVIGTGLAQSCFQSAEFASDTRSGIETCTQAIEVTALTPTDRAATFINRGILRSRGNDPMGALRDYDMGLSIDASLAEGYVDRGATKIVLKRYKEAVKDINRGIELGAKRPHIAYYDRAIAYEALGNVRGAYEDYKKAVELEPEFTLAIEQLQRFKVVRKHNDGA